MRKKETTTTIWFFLLLVVPRTVFSAENPALGVSDKKEIVLKVDSVNERVLTEEIDDWFTTSSRLYFDPVRKTEIENTRFCPEGNFFCDFILTTKKRLTVNHKNDYEINKENITAYLEDLGRKINKDPINAKFKLEDGGIVVFLPEEKGIKLDIPNSLETISRHLSERKNYSETIEIDLVYEAIKPEISVEDIKNLGIKALIGEGKSNFRGSPKNRVHNIKIAASRFDGVLVKPQEEFSFVKILGEVDGEHGYLPELVIKHNKTEPEFGGGICQVSTTAFRAAIYSGLKITARRNHAYPVRYYNPQGLDATVYVPSPDLRFLNNTPGHILIQTKIEGTELIFQIYGSDDGRTVNVDGPKILERNADGSMKTTFTQIVNDREGREMIKDIFNSAYDSPSKYPHPGEESLLKEKPRKWSDKEWKEYKKAHGI